MALTNEKLTEELAKMTEMMTKLSDQNNELQKKVQVMEAEKNEKDLKSQRIEANKTKRDNLLEELVKLQDELINVETELREDGVDIPDVMENHDAVPELEDAVRDETPPGSQVGDVPPVVSLPFSNSARGEKIEINFGEDCTPKNLRRFIENYRVVREINTNDRIVGWDVPSFRANKLRLAIRGEASDYLSTESSMLKPWTKNDDEIIQKLKDRYLNTQAIEMNILEFEQSSQDTKETLPEYMSRLQQLVTDAYDGDTRAELDKKVAWRFVNGLRSENVRRELMKEGWMADRRQAKPLETILSIAEVARRTEEAVKSTGPSGSTGNVGALRDKKNL